jgi:hypothetical protein
LVKRFKVGEMQQILENMATVKVELLLVSTLGELDMCILFSSFAPCKPLAYTTTSTALPSNAHGVLHRDIPQSSFSRSLFRP